MTDRPSTCPKCKTARSVKEGIPNKCQICQFVYQQVNCAFCSHPKIFPKPKYHAGSKRIKCDVCQKFFQQLNCSHCYRSVVYKKCIMEEGTIIICPYKDCKKTFQQVECPNCLKVIDYKKCDYKMGKKFECVYPNCKKKFQQLNCGHCKQTLVWKNASYTENRKIICPYRNCKKNFQSLYCPHCDQRLIYKNSNYHEGKVHKCPYTNCRKSFQQMICGHCSRNIVWKKCDYNEGKKVQCPYTDCKKTFQQICCPHCQNSIMWNKANKRPSRIYVCPYKGCGKSYQQMNCSHCKKSVVFKKANYMNGQYINCPYKDCQKKFLPKMVTYQYNQKQVPKNQKPVIKPQSFYRHSNPKYHTLVVKQYENECSPIVKGIIQKGEAWTDVSFPPTPESINMPNKDFEWKRIREILGNDIKMFDKVSIDDVHQGEVGDCWLLSSINSTCKYPWIVEKMFLTKDVNKSGIYELQFCKHGKWSRVIVDDWFPVKRGTNTLAFSKPNGKEIWVLLIEKAFAKLHRAYGNIGIGVATDGLSDISGCPVKTYSIDNDRNVKKLIEKNQFFFLILRLCREKHPLVATTRSNFRKDETGIVPGHVYCIYEMSEKYRLLRVRNPWGYFEWKGDWSDGDTKNWTESRKKELNWVNKDDGSFWISWFDFKKYFGHVGLGFIKEGWSEKRLRVVKDMAIMLEIKSDLSEIICGIHQQDVRVNPAALYYPAGFVVCSWDEKKIFLYEGMDTRRTFHALASESNNWFITTVLNKGKYKIIPIVSWLVDDPKKEIYFSVHSNAEDFAITKMNYKIQNVPRIVMNSSLEIQHTMPQKWKGNEMCLYRYWRNGDIILIMHWKVACDFPKMQITATTTLKNMHKIIPENLSFVITPHQKVVVGWYSKMDNSAYSINYTFKMVPVKI